MKENEFIAKKEIKALRKILSECIREFKSLNYTFEIRQGGVVRTIMSEVYNGTEFDEN